ncbi:hypothetical protein [Ferrovibrio sp.]|uniref:hypothetical protein n=1 Tax=Ferrovibrio sp. TaxID=1917215 RepID=UPI0025C2E8E0|nr:hypothetical protein [Ferrovibrio sp.]MBX3455147.1 hypothetical protein [Ferrovibrio sp.]
MASHDHHHSGHHDHHAHAAFPAGSLAVRVLAAGAGQRILMVLPAIAVLWAAVAWALLSDH